MLCHGKRGDPGSTTARKTFQRENSSCEVLPVAGNYINAKIQCFDCNKLPLKERIGQGTFGDAYTTEYRFQGDATTTTVVVKKMLQVLDQEEKRLFVKDAALLNELHHRNTLKFKAFVASLSP